MPWFIYSIDAKHWKKIKRHKHIWNIYIFIYDHIVNFTQHSGVRHILCCVFVLFFFVLCFSGLSFLISPSLKWTHFQMYYSPLRRYNANTKNVKTHNRTTPKTKTISNQNTASYLNLHLEIKSEGILKSKLYSSVAIYHHHQRIEYTFQNAYVILEFVPSRAYHL
jgi:predicted PurR-regulated permease PerM